MRNFLIIAALFMTMSAWADQANIQKVFVPDGYDTTDVVEIVLKGSFSDACNVLETPRVLIDHENKKISITPKSYHRENVVCIQMVSPFTQVINLGKLPAGGYRVEITTQPQIENNLKVAASNTENIDNYLYAPVEYADIKKEDNSSLFVTLQGRYPLLKKGCMEIKGVITHQYKNDVIVIQPISEINDDAYCAEHPVVANFSYEVAVPKLKAPEALIHVRTLNGGSYNRVVELK